MIDEIEAHYKNIRSIDKSSAKLGRLMILGYGGGGFAMEDSRFTKICKVFKKRIKEFKPKKLILVVHGPPYGSKVDKLPGGYAGNSSYTKFIKEVQPDLVVCGHLHETTGKKDKIGKSLIINPGKKGMVNDV